MDSYLYIRKLRHQEVTLPKVLLLVFQTLFPRVNIINFGTHNKVLYFSFCFLLIDDLYHKCTQKG